MKTQWVSSVLFILLALPGAGTVRASPDSDKQLDERVEAFLAPLVDNAIVSGTVLIAHGAEIGFCRGFGLANRDHGIRNACDTPFRIASVSKALTAVAVLQLVDRGELQLDDPVSKFFPDCAHGAPIRVRQLLSHSSGLPSTPFIEGYFEKSLRDHSLEQEIEWICSERPRFEPGDHFEYSNSGYILLSGIIQETSGVPFGHYMKSRVFTPAGMFSTGLDSWGAIVLGRATGYSRNSDGALVRAAYRNPSDCFGCGAFYSTAPDLLAYLRALLDGRLLSTRSREAMWTPSWNTSWGDQYGFGWFIQGDREEISARGGTSGFMSRLTYFPKEDLIVAVLLNQDFMLDREFFEGISEIALGGAPRQLLSTEAEDLDAHPLARFVGRYKMDDGVAVRFLLDESGFYLEEDPSHRFRVFPVDEHTGYASEPNARLIFVQDPTSGTVALRALYGVLLWRGERVEGN